MSNDLLRDFLELIDRTRLSVDQAAVFTGLASHTIRLILASRRLPTRKRCLDAIADFVDRHRGVAARDGLRMPPGEVHHPEVHPS